MTPSTRSPPFVVALYDGDTLVSERLFANHDAATAYALDALHVAAHPAD